MSKRVIPPYIFCVKCGEKVELLEDTSPETLEALKRHGYTTSAKGACECGVFYVLCYQPLPASPTFSLFFDIYPVETIKKMKKTLLASTK